MSKSNRPVSKQPIPAHAEKVFSGELFDVHQWEQELYDGSTVTFEKVARCDSVGVIAVTTEGEILTTTQKQPGMESFKSLVGGWVDPGEEPHHAAHRELREETGYAAAEWELWFATQPFGKIDWTVYVYIARGCHKVTEPEVDPGEKITVQVVPFAEFVALAVDPEFRDLEVTLRILRAQVQGELETLRELLVN
jgi:8-oxo-dGTP pyrophosphatase MutT (NUDIX family)